MRRIRLALALCGLSLMLAGAGCQSLHHKDCCDTKAKSPFKGFGHGKDKCVAPCDTACAPRHASLFGGKKGNCCEAGCGDSCKGGGLFAKDKCGECCEKGCNGKCGKSSHFWLFGKNSCCENGCKDKCDSGCDKCDSGHQCFLFGKDKCNGCETCKACKGQCKGQCNGKCNGPCGPCGCTQYQNQLVSEMGLGVAQTMVFGEIQVDEFKLERILESRRRQREEEQRVYNEYVHAQEQFYREQRERQLRQYVDTLAVAGNCSGPAMADPACAPPYCPTACPLPPPPPCLPLRPAEIPLVIPVTLEVGLENTCISQPCVRQIPLPPACKRPCPPACPPAACPTPPTAVPANPGTLPPAPLGKTGGRPAITPASASAE